MLAIQTSDLGGPINRVLRGDGRQTARSCQSFLHPFQLPQNCLFSLSLAPHLEGSARLEPAKLHHGRARRRGRLEKLLKESTRGRVGGGLHQLPTHERPEPSPWLPAGRVPKQRLSLVRGRRAASFRVGHEVEASADVGGADPAYFVTSTDNGHEDDAILAS
jgi:hypothetical protein